MVVEVVPGTVELVLEVLDVEVVDEVDVDELVTVPTVLLVLVVVLVASSLTRTTTLSMRNEFVVPSIAAVMRNASFPSKSVWGGMSTVYTPS